MKNFIYTTTALFLLCAMQATVAQAQTDDSILSDSHIVRQDFVEAEIIRVSSRDRTITVKGEKRGQTRQFTIPEGVRISLNGNDARLKDLRRGDNIMVKFVQSPNKVVVDQIRVPSAPVTLAQRRANPVVAEARPATLPSTASYLPAILLLGLISLGGASLMRRLRA